jgi:Mce-associated membrane protein
VTTPLNDSLTQDPDVSSSPQTPRDPAGSRLGWGIAAVLTVLAVVAAVLIVLEVVSLRPRAEQATADESARSGAVSAAERFTTQFNTYDSASLPAYEKSLKSMMSPKFRASFEKAITQLAASIKQGKIRSKGQVLASAVATQDSDSAQVLVVSDASVHTIYDPNVARHFRWQVSLVKINGQWLVDSYEPVD